jgi:hypothetical protein
MPGSDSELTAAYHPYATCCLAGDMEDGVDGTLVTAVLDPEPCPPLL